METSQIILVKAYNDMEILGEELIGKDAVAGEFSMTNASGVRDWDIPAVRLLTNWARNP